MREALLTIWGLIVFIVILSVVTVFGFVTAKSRDNELRELRVEYEQASGRVADLIIGIESLEGSVGRVAGQLDQDATSLRSTIEVLKTIAIEVTIMEDTISSLRSPDSNVSNDTDSEIDTTAETL